MNIAEVSKKYDISADTLRYYERVGLIPPVPRSPSGIRNYDNYSCGWVEYIKCMRGAGLPIETLIEYVKMYQEGIQTADARKELLMEQRMKLLEKEAALRATIERLDHKIDWYASGEAVKHQQEQEKKNRHR